MPHSADPIEKQKKDKKLCQLAFGSKSDKKSNFHTPSRSAGTDATLPLFLKILKKLLNVWRKQELLEYLMIAEDGTTPVAQRMDIVDEFNNDPQKFVFLISTKAGGVGLNLTSANVVDLQAQDRAFRIGQTRDVQVYRLIAAGSLEELKYGRQQLANIGYSGSHERRYFEGVMDDPGQKGELFGLANLFALYRDKDVITKLIVKRTERAEIEFDIQDTKAVETKPREVREMGEEEEPRDQEDDGEGDMQYLAKMMTDPEKAKEEEQKRKSCLASGIVDNILEECGVGYVHANDDIIGSSKIEEKISNMAQKAVQMHLGSQALAWEHDLDVDENADPFRRAAALRRKRKRNDDDIIVGATPPDIRQQQLEQMCTLFNFPDVEAFARRVLEFTEMYRGKSLIMLREELVKL
ncbi:hypothetical protein HK102_011695 [Quaeritorhiza haematococci]|nr:hypothetical protein HK102_011695 [Quaeritorhiza haematococci]